MSTTQSSPNISPTVDSPSLDTTPPPTSDTSAPPPTSGSSAPPPPNSPPPTPDPVTPPPLKSEPPASQVVVSPPPPSTTPPPVTPSTPIAPPPASPSTPDAPPSTSPPITPSTPSTPNVPLPSTPPTSTPNVPPPSSPPPSTPNAPPPSSPPPSTPNAPPPSSPPPSTPNAPPRSTTPPSTPNAPPPIDISPPPPNVPSPPPPKNSSSRPSPSPPPPQRKPEVPPPSPSPPVHTASPPSIPVPPKQSPPPPAVAPPPADSSAPPVSEVLSPPNATLPSPTVPASSSPPPTQNNTFVSPYAPTVDSSPESTNNTTASTTREAGGIPAGGAIAIVFAGLLALGLVVFAAWFVQKRKKKRTGSNEGYMVPSPFVSSPSSDSAFLRDQNAAIGSARQSPYHSSHLNGSSSKTNFAYNGDPGGVGNSKPWFTYEELVEATNGFSEDNLLGEGGFGCVYKGNLADGREVAVKQLKIGGKQGEREFRAEVDIISRIHHRHLVSIVGYCISDFQRLLVYDYVPNNTLHYHLHGNVPVMTWVTRFKVASGAARGIAYLHEDCTPRIIHRDIKSSNILLDNNFEAKVADFGLAKLALDLEAHTHVSTRIMGTFGYMAPEYATTGKLTEKSDVFSFGVVLLELITGRKPVDSSQPLGDESLVGWARPLLTKALETEDFDNLVDLRLESNFVKIQMFRLIEAAAACVRHSASKRPKMSQVVRALDSIGEMSDLSNGMKPGDSQIIDSREQSAQIRMFQRMAFGSQNYGTDFSGDSRNSWSGL